MHHSPQNTGWGKVTAHCYYYLAIIQNNLIGFLICVAMDVSLFSLSLSRLHLQLHGPPGWLQLIKEVRGYATGLGRWAGYEPGKQACEWSGHWVWSQYRKENNDRFESLPALKAWRQALAVRRVDQHWQSQHRPHHFSLDAFLLRQQCVSLKDTDLLSLSRGHFGSRSRPIAYFLYPGPVPVLFMAWTEEALILSYTTMEVICARCLAIFVVTHFIIIATAYRWNNSLNTSLLRGTHSDRVKWNMSSRWPDKRIAY